MQHFDELQTRGHILVFWSSGGPTFNPRSGRIIDVVRSGGVCRLKGDMTAINVWTSEDADDFRPRDWTSLGGSLGRPECCTSVGERDRGQTTRFECWCQHSVRAKDKRRPGSVSKFATDHMLTGEDGAPITILAGHDGVTKAFFANLKPCRGTRHGGTQKEHHPKLILQSDQELSIIDDKYTGTLIPIDINYEESRSVEATRS